MIRPVEDHELSGEDIHDLHQVERRSCVLYDQMDVDVPARLRPIPRERPHSRQARPCRWEEGSQGEDDDRRQREEDQLPASESQTGHEKA